MCRYEIRTNGDIFLEYSLKKSIMFLLCSKPKNPKLSDFVSQLCKRLPTNKYRSIRKLIFIEMTPGLK